SSSEWMSKVTSERTSGRQHAQPPVGIALPAAKIDDEIVGALDQQEAAEAEQAIDQVDAVEVHRDLLAQRMVGVEIPVGNIDAARRQLLHEPGTDACGAELADDRPIRIGSAAHEAEDLLHLDDVAFHAGNLGDADHLAPPVAQPLQLDDDVERRGNLLAHAARWKV